MRKTVRHARESVVREVDANNLENQRRVGDVAIGRSLPEEGTRLDLEKTLVDLEVVKATCDGWSWQVRIRESRSRATEGKGGCHREAADFCWWGFG